MRCPGLATSNSAAGKSKSSALVACIDVYAATKSKPSVLTPCIDLSCAWAALFTHTQEQCAFNGAWGGNVVPTAFYVSSYFWDRAADAGIIGEKSAIAWSLKPDDFSSAATSACSSSVAALGSAFPHVRAPAHLPSRCLLSLRPDLPLLLITAPARCPACILVSTWRYCCSLLNVVCAWCCRWTARRRLSCAWT